MSSYEDGQEARRAEYAAHRRLVIEVSRRLASWALQSMKGADSRSHKKAEEAVCTARRANALSALVLELASPPQQVSEGLVDRLVELRDLLTEDGF